MAFAVRYKPWTVFAAALAASAVTHLLAVAAGGLVTTLVPLHWVRLAAALAFIAFGVWTLWPEKEEGEEAEAEAGKNSSRAPFWTVAGAFFLAEMGDKTQLATMTLAAEYQAPALVWLGAVLAMAAVDGVAIVAGVLLHKRIPERAVKVAAGVAFLAFGLLALFGDGLKHSS